MEIIPGNIYVARGGIHMHFAKKTSGTIVVREDKEKGTCYFQPSVNEMMLSAARIFPCDKLVGVLLTGIGDDGADGMVKIKTAGGYTVAEAEETCTVYGMPKEAYDRGGVSQMMGFPDILKKIVSYK